LLARLRFLLRRANFLLRLLHFLPRSLSFLWRWVNFLSRSLSKFLRRAHFLLRLLIFLARKASVLVRRLRSGWWGLVDLWGIEYDEGTLRHQAPFFGVCYEKDSGVWFYGGFYPRICWLRNHRRCGKRGAGPGHIPGACGASAGLHRGRRQGQEHYHPDTRGLRKIRHISPPWCRGNW